MTWRRATKVWFGHLSAEWQVRTALGVGLTVSNAVGIILVYVLTTLVVPMPPVNREVLVQRENILLGAVCVAVAAVVGTVNSYRVLHPVVVMLRPGSEPGDVVRRDVLSAPRRLFVFQAVLWGLASVVFFAFNLPRGLDLAVAIFVTVALAGFGTSCQTYLLAERALRPVARRVLADGLPPRRTVRSVADRQMFAWALGTGVPTIGITLTGVLTLLDAEGTVSVEQLAITIVALGAITLVFGWLSSFIAAQASSEPIQNLREAVSRVERGELGVTVPIYDATEIGVLQAGFNRMVAGLREREDLRDLFGRHVGEHVAREALAGGVRLGGEVRDVAVLFVDLVGSTSFAERRDPEEVVGTLNRFFDIVIDVVHAHDGWINKFQGDAALAIWGAPTEVEDRATLALRASRVLGRRLEAELPELRAGIGLSCGSAVAGNVGAAERYEYTVIGDPVNEAARLTDHAKRIDRRVVANCALVESADPEEAAHWRPAEPVTVRGRSTPTQVACPVD